MLVASIRMDGSWQMHAHTLTGDFASWMQGSAFINADGTPQRFFHGTDVIEPFNVFTRWEDFSVGFHFGSEATARKRIADIECEDGRLIAVFCRARSPLRLQDHLTWSLRNIVRELEDLGIIDDRVADLIYENYDAYLFAALERAGYDCIVYDNVTEQGGDSLIVWRAELLKGVTANRFDPMDPRLDPERDCLEVDRMAHAHLASEIAKARVEIDALLSPSP